MSGSRSVHPAVIDVACAATGVPGSVLATPCGDEDVVGVIELVRWARDGFSFDDVDSAELTSVAAIMSSATAPPVSTSFIPYCR